MVTYAECLTFGDYVSNIDFDLDLFSHVIYFNVVKLCFEERRWEGWKWRWSTNLTRDIGLIEDIEVHDIWSLFVFFVFGNIEL